MRKLAVLAACLACALVLFSQEIQHEAISINIEVPVRVFRGESFVDSLTIDDFELFENGILQTIDAVYLIKKTDLERQDTRIDTKTEEKIFDPQLSRQFVLIFEIREVFAEVEDSIKHFFDHVLIPSDRLLLATPKMTYHFKENSWEFVPKEEMAGQMIERLKKDILIRPVDWGNLDEYLADEEINRNDMEDVYFGQRYIDEENLNRVADYLKTLPGQKNVFLFLQQELIDYAMPTGTSTVGEMISNLDYLTNLSRIASYGEVSSKTKRAFSDPTILFNLIYLKNTKDQTTSSLSEKIDLAGGMFETFHDLTRITGGFSQTTGNASASFEKAVDASENYYLVYYTPIDYKADGKFKRIRVKVKGQNYRIIHRTGYIAD